MDISLEKIELVKDRTGVSYKEAKEALEQMDGNVVDAIIFIEETIDDGRRLGGEGKGAAVIESIKELIRKGNVTRIVVRKEDDVLLSLPVNVGLLGAAIFPGAAILSSIAAFGTKCTIELVKDDGDVISVNEKAAEKFETVRSKGSVIVDEMKDKGEDIVDVAVEKGQAAWTVAKEKSSEVIDTVKEKAAEKKKQAEEDGLDGLFDFDLSDADAGVEAVVEEAESEDQ